MMGLAHKETTTGVVVSAARDWFMVIWNLMLLSTSICSHEMRDYSSMGS